MNTTRRSFLGGVAVASALTATAAAQTSSTTAEHPELIRLGADFDRAHQRMTTAQDKLPAYQAAYREIAPTGEGLLIDSYSPEYRRNINLLELFVDPTSPTFQKLKGKTGWGVYRICTYRLDQMIETAPRSNLPALRELRARSSKFDADIETALKASGLQAALDEYWQAEMELRKVVRAIVEVRASTMHGLALKVRATAAFAAIGNEEKFSASMWLSDAIWSDLGAA